MPHDRQQTKWMSASLGSLDEINASVLAPVLSAHWTGRAWAVFAVSCAFTLLFIGSAIWLLRHGIGIFGNNTTVVWGFPLANYVWWIGIGNAGTLISALLLLTRQKWRASLNRFAETMTLFAVAMAGLFPIFHLGRPERLYWLLPYPNVMGLWPQWRSALVWDFWAIATYLLFSILFWYAGLIPDLATLRDRARHRLTRKLYGAFALGWTGSLHDWAVHERFYKYMAALAVPLVITVHSIVGLDFAASLEPGWQDPLYPPYFVVGALYSGFATVAILAAILRWAHGWNAFITPAHFEIIARILLAASIVMGLSYASEWFSGWFNDTRTERDLVRIYFTGAYGWIYVLQLLFNVALPQALWSARIRSSIPALLLIAMAVNIGMWIERILIVWNTLGHDYLPSMWRLFTPSLWDWIMLFGSLGTFVFLFMIFTRLLPALSLHELRKLWVEEART